MKTDEFLALVKRAQFGDADALKALPDAALAHYTESMARVLPYLEACGGKPELIGVDMASDVKSPEDILRRLMTNPHLSLADQTYQVREREGKGWNGPAVKAWSDAVGDAEAWMKANPA